MAIPPEPDTPEEHAAMNDFRTSLWIPFQTMYEDKWSQEKWESAVADYRQRHSPQIVQQLFSKKILPPWEALESQLRKGPPPFLRPGWTSPLLGKKVNLDWIDRDEYICIQGTRDGWRNCKVLVIEFWASWCRPCHRVFDHLSEINETKPEVKVITFNNEGIFSNIPTDIHALKYFIARKNNLNYPIFVDEKRIAIDALFRPGQNLSIPLVFLITPEDGVVHWVGNADAEDMGEPLERLLSKLNSQ
ncbi:hypothetical protein ABKN59_005021 [Abortiporus biennis]